MFRQLLARLIPKRHPFRSWATRATEPRKCEPPCDTVLGEVYQAHAAIHGFNKLLPGEAFPGPPEGARTSDTGSTSKLA
jgi:hypothetical protein